MHDISNGHMHEDTLETTISVHSPLIQCSTTGNYYTSYAVSLKSNNSCFTFSNSHVRRRYSEFVHLRNLLKAHHPTISAPVLPGKNYFYRFNQVFIEERKRGLQRFLQEVLDTPVYLSSKCVHLFLQSASTMSEINEQVKGDVPAPKLMSCDNAMLSFHSDSSSISSTESSDHRRTSKTKSVSVGESGERTKTHNSFGKAIAESPPIPILHKKNRKSFHASDFLVDSPSSLDSGNCSLESSSHSRRVSFNENVTVAIVCNHLWNYDIKPIKAGA